MAERNDLHLINEKDRIAPTGYTDWSEQQTLTVASDPTIPSAPTLAAAAEDQAIDLTITAPETNTDGTAIVDILEYNIYWATAAKWAADGPISVTDAGTYSGMFTVAATRKTYPTSSQLYFKATCVDKWGNESAGSNEVNATPTVASGVPVSVDDYTDNFASILTGYGNIGIIFNVPKSTWERWAGWKLYANNDGGAGSGALTGDPVSDGTPIYTGSNGSFIYKNLNTAWLYEFELVVLGEDGTVTAGTVDDNAGAGYQPNDADNSNFTGTVLAQDVVAVNEVRGNHFYASSYLHIGVPGWQSDGCQFEYNGGNPRGYVGDGANAFWEFDGTKLTWKAANTELDASGNLTATSVTLTGSITATSGAIGGFTLNASHLYTGTKTAYNDANAGVHLGTDGIGFGNNVFTVSAAGVLVATSATITGTITIGAGSSYTGNAIGTAYTDADVTADNTAAAIAGQGALATLSSVGAANCNTTIISGGKIITGLLTASNIQTGTLNCSLLTVANINAASITVGTLGVAYTEADVTADNTAAAIAGQGSLATLSAVGAANCNTTIISGGKIITGLLTASNIQTGTLSAARITIDTDLNFKPSATYQAITGLEGIFQSTTKSTAYPYIQLEGGAYASLEISSGTQAGADVWINAKDSFQVYAEGGLYMQTTGGDFYVVARDECIITSTAGYVKLVSGGSGMDILLDSADDIKFSVADATGDLIFRDWERTQTTSTASGWIKVVVNGYTRYLQCYTATPS